MPGPARRVPARPLFAQAALRLGIPLHTPACLALHRHGDRQRECLTEVGLGHLFDVAPRQVVRWKAYGLVVRQADEAAARLGLHPIEIWGDDWLFEHAGAA